MANHPNRRAARDWWPVFSGDDDAACFSCGEALSGEAKDSGYARGQRSQRCGKCGHVTYYDIVDP